MTRRPESFGSLYLLNRRRRERRVGGQAQDCAVAHSTGLRWANQLLSARLFSQQAIRGAVTGDDFAVKVIANGRELLASLVNVVIVEHLSWREDA